MKPEEIITQAKRISVLDGIGMFVESREFLRLYAGENSEFYKRFESFSTNLVRNETSRVVAEVREILFAFIRFIENGLNNGNTIKREAQIEVVSDFLAQAEILIKLPDVHPAAPTVLIGASLEEYLRNWIDEAGFEIGTRKPGMESYSAILRENELISRQDTKDITSWAGLRNHAAHGEWDEVKDKQRITIMLEGVNLFMRKYSERNK